jgi:type IV secretory pathway TraG/TraD family ATPase VirD4
MLESWGVAGACVLLILLALVVWLAGAIGNWIQGRPMVGNPFSYPFELASGQARWPGLPATLVLLVVAVLVLTGLAVAAVLVWRSANRPQSVLRVDRAARMMGRPNDLKALSPAGVAASASRLRSSGVDPHDPAQHGRLVGHTVVGNMPVRMSWEDTGLHIWGPRIGKTTCLTIPMVIEAPGPVAATSNKRDLVDGTRGVRASLGAVWIFDPQQVATAPCSWWYNPLTRISNIRDAEVLAGHFVTGSRDPQAQTQAYFDGSAETLLSSYLLAARRAGASLKDVYLWIADSTKDEPERALEAAGDEMAVADVKSVREAPEKQKEGVFETAKQLLKCLRDPAVLAWVTPSDDERPEFRPEEFVEGTDTLYSLSMEVPGAAYPLVAALTEHVCTAAQNTASTQRMGRLDPPLTVVLDEAANVCRWRELPSLYSHFGSRGIVLDTILQNYSQGVEVWGERGMKKLWDAANLRTYGGGIADDAFLETLSRLVGEFEAQSWSTSVDSTGRRSRSSSPRMERVLTLDLLAAMPFGRALVLATGAPAFLVKPQPWMAGPHAVAVRNSIDAYDPGSAQHQVTLAKDTAVEEGT